MGLRASKDSLEKLAGEVKDLAGRGESKAAERLYREKVFPLVRELFLEQASEILRGRKYRYLILTTGKTPEPLILSVSAFRPRKAFFLYTEGSEGTIEVVAEACGLRFSEVERRRVSPADVRDVYAAVREIVRDAGGVRDLAIDITGGTKVMVGGCSMAAALLRVDTFYVESESGWCLGKSRPGTEKLVSLRNPYEVFGDVEMKIGVELFNSCVFTSARGIFGRLATSGVEESKTRTYLILSEAYECWDRFHYGDARSKLDEVLRRLDHVQVLPDDKVHLLKRQLELLGLLKRNDKEDLSRLLKDEAFAAALMTDIYANAKRRERQGRYDDGIIRLYRILELISQSRLTRIYRIDPSSANGIPPEAADKFAELNVELFGSSREVPEKLALIDGWTLLYALGDKGLGIEGLDELKAFKDTVQSRNLLMVEHSNEARDRQEYNKFNGFVLPYLRRAVPDLEERLSLHSFIEL